MPRGQYPRRRREQTNSTGPATVAPITDRIDPVIDDLVAERESVASMMASLRIQKTQLTKAIKTLEGLRRRAAS